MRRFTLYAFSVYTSVVPARILAPEHRTPKPTIPYLIAYSAQHYRVPVDMALRLGWGESSWRNVSSANRDGSRNWGPVQVSDRYTPGIEAMSVLDRINAGMRIFSAWRIACRGNEACAISAYRKGHL